MSWYRQLWRALVVPEPDQARMQRFFEQYGFAVQRRGLLARDATAVAGIAPQAAVALEVDQLRTAFLFDPYGAYVGAVAMGGERNGTTG